MQCHAVYSSPIYTASLNSKLLQIVKTPAWLKVLQISIGVISIILSGYVLLYPRIALLTAVLILSIVLLIVGIERIAIGIFSSYHRNSSSRISNIGLGALAIAFSILVMAFPLFSILFLIYLGGFALLFNGIARIIQGVGGQGISGWPRVFLIGVGILSIVISGLVIAHPIGFGVRLLVVIMSLALMIIGIEMIAIGTAGRQIARTTPQK
jgi:uncharacterized membrane protein HdeD (DUF308 family)